jgi:hypothetical protein
MPQIRQWLPAAASKADVSSPAVPVAEQAGQSWQPAGEPAPAKS